MRKQRSIFIVFSRDISPETNSTGYTIAKKQFLHRGTPAQMTKIEDTTGEKNQTCKH